MPIDAPAKDDLGRLIRAARAYAGLTSTELARRLGIARVTLGEWESGSIPHLPGRREWIVKAVAEATGVDAEFLEGVIDIAGARG